MRLNKFISHNTKYSRRAADDLISSSRVSINGKIISDLSSRVDENDEVSLDGKIIKIKAAHTFIVYNKPKGELVTHKDDRSRRIIFDSLPKHFGGFVSVGRLDFASEGLIILGDDKKIVSLLESSSLERSYNIKIAHTLSDDMIKSMFDGVYIENALDGAHEKTTIKSMHIKPIKDLKILHQSTTHTRLRITITEGKNTELRRLFAHFKRPILDLKRVSFGPFFLNSLKSGSWRYFSKDEYKILRQLSKELSCD